MPLFPVLMANMLGIKFTDTGLLNPEVHVLVTDPENPWLVPPHPVWGSPGPSIKPVSGRLQDLRDSTLPRLINPPCMPLGAVISEHL